MRKFSRKQIGAVGLAVMMSAQGPVMAAEEMCIRDRYYAVTGTNETIGGKLYHFNLDGTMASQGWGLHEDGSWYYAYASGELARCV